MKSCVECVVRKTGFPIYATIAVHPNLAKCNSAVVGELQLETNANPKSVKKTNPNATFFFDVLQSTCFAGGTTLQVFIPDANLQGAQSEYSFLWEIDGKKAGHQSKIECCCGKEAIVRVTKIRTGETGKRILKLSTCKNTNDK